MKKIVIAFLASILLMSCKKYDEGPAFSLRSVSERITGDWILENYLINNEDSTTFYISLVGNCEYSFHITKSKNQPMGTGSCGNNPTYGEWGLNDDKKMLGIIVYTSSFPGIFVVTNTTFWKILRLTNKQMWLESEQLGKMYNIKLKKTHDRKE